MRKKISLFLLTLLTVYVFTFFVPRLMPGDPFSYSDFADASDTTNLMTDAQKKVLMAYYGLDRPLGEQFLETLKKNLSGDFGSSIYYKKTVWDAVTDKLGWSLGLMAATLIISLLLGVALALAALSRKRLDAVLYGFMSVAAEIPAFLVGIALLFLVAARLRFIPLSGGETSFAVYESLWQRAGDVLLHALMPVAAMVIVTTPLFYATARSCFLRIHGKRYLLTARAKGLSAPRIRFYYILLNGMAPLLARFFLSVGACVGATLLVENVFAYPGLGKLMRDAVQYRDYPLIQGIFLLVTLFVLTSSFVSDIISSLVSNGGERDI
ncbi:MAG: ABC transporter permease [Clostridiales Family XIII bacterium]|jgi:peptide/nickel transport system permease protein|nr:ABC transporter permease [Clostridiales Family XIII bacterium]